MRSDHTAVQTTFKITDIKFKVIEKILTYIGWKIIGYHKTTNDLFKNILYMSADGRTK